MSSLENLRLCVLRREGRGSNAPLARRVLRGIDLLSELFQGKAQAVPSFADLEHNPEAEESGADAARWLEEVERRIARILRPPSLVIKTMHMVHGQREYFPFDEETTLNDVQTRLLERHRESIVDYLARYSEDRLEEGLHLDFYDGCPALEKESRPLDSSLKVCTLANAETDGVYWWPHITLKRVKPERTSFSSLLVDDSNWIGLIGGVPRPLLSDYYGVEARPTRRRFAAILESESLASRGGISLWALPEAATPAFGLPSWALGHGGGKPGERPLMRKAELVRRFCGLACPCESGVPYSKCCGSLGEAAESAGVPAASLGSLPILIPAADLDPAGFSVSQLISSWIEERTDACVGEFTGLGAEAKAALLAVRPAIAGAGKAPSAIGHEFA